MWLSPDEEFKDKFMMQKTFLLLSFFIVFGAQAGSISGVDFSDQTTLDGKTLVLNGMGLRQATIFHVNVYAAGLYISSKSQKAPEILADTNPKKFEMRFMRDVGAGDIKDAWEDSLGKMCGDGCKLKDKVTQFISWTTDVKKNDTLDYIFHSDRLEFTQNGKTVGVVDSADFGRLVLSVWLGENAKYKDLKNGLLGTAN
jgi:Chalcone isomerase-like